MDFLIILLMVYKHLRKCFKGGDLEPLRPRYLSSIGAGLGAAEALVHRVEIKVIDTFLFCSRGVIVGMGPPKLRRC